MKIYTNNKFTGHWPVGTAAVIRAESPEDAALLLAHELKEHGLEQIVKPEDMEPFTGISETGPLRILQRKADWQPYLTEWANGLQPFSIMITMGIWTYSVPMELQKNWLNNIHSFWKMMVKVTSTM